MRRLLLAGVAFLSLSSVAHAQIPVTDVASIAQEAKSYLQEIKSYLTQLQQYATEVQTYETDAQMLLGFVHNPNLGAVMGLANRLGLSSDLPVNLGAVQGLVSGYGGITSIGALTGKLSSLGAMVNGSFSNDTLYQCHDSSFACMQSNAQAAGNAGVKGIASQVIQDMENHLPVLQGLRDRLATADNPKDVADVQAQIQVEQSWVNNEMGQLQAVAMLNQAQQQVSSEQRVQKLNADFDTLKASMPN
jgi:type IV secretion system protein VirB5